MFLVLFYSFQFTFDPLHRTELFTMAFVLVTLLGMLAGFISARFYKFFNGTSWLRCAVITALFIPSIFVIYFVAIDFIDWWERTLTTPFTTMSLIIVSWVACNLVTIFIGSWLGFTMKKLEVPAKPSRIPRQISDTAKSAPFYVHWIVTVPTGSFLCFSCISTEVYYLITSVWRENCYMMFFYLSLSLILMAIVAA
jgi:transmembrane 9 superfamily protein 2/4